MDVPIASNRPQTSRPRGICRYHQAPRGCFTGDKCKFLHAKPPESPDSESLKTSVTPYDAAKSCRYYANGYCKRGSECWFRHVIEPNATRGTKNPGIEEELFCSVCLEKPVTFGLLDGCNHVFCIQCIRQWRDPSNKHGDLADSMNMKKCPMCRSPSKFVTPSSSFWSSGEEGKAKAIQAYKESMAKVPCRYFQYSKLQNRKKPFCPFGRDCFYRHLNGDGTPYIFRDGVDVYMRVRISSFLRIFCIDSL
ncbi:hypothetical protein AMATHDRAFT_153580 [Amanita thiersii Skay4041]|uniref:Uncharacterized protein n=1 Tax=Amanita thiersii Skay4041 TaxID=703135 RepID=A0A2A9NGM6_9AGAR|nr:hypothetical protein AMATHDRAFT_153580 [Amanita thiersii Skay4041]